MIVYISIGNSDDKLTQAEWSSFHNGTEGAILSLADKVHGRWLSVPSDPWQNACWCVEVESLKVARLKQSMRNAAALYRQDSIAWAEVLVTEFLGASDG
jgi:hypothetical protein